MPVNFASRGRERHSQFNKSVAKGLLKRVRANLRSAFNKAFLAHHAGVIQKDASTNRVPNVPGNDLFQGASTVLDVTNVVQAPSPPRPTGLTIRYVIRSRENRPSSTNDSSDRSGLKAQRPCKKPSQISASSLAQPSVYFAPPSQLGCQLLDEQHLAALATSTALFGNDEADHLDIQQKQPSTEAQPERAAIAEAGFCRTKQGSLSEKVNSQILGSSLSGTDPSSQLLSPSLSSRHLPSGASSKDTFALRRKPKPPNPGSTSVLFGGMETLSDPFIQSEPEKECLEMKFPVSVGDAKTQAEIVPISETTTVAETHTPKSPARWSDDYDQFSSDRQNRRLIRIASGQYELLDRGYHLNPPPMLDTRIPRVRTLVPDDSSDEDGAMTPQPEHFRQEREPLPQEQLLPQAIPVMVPLATAIKNAQSAVNGRVAARDEELATALQNVQQRDAEIARLKILLSTRDAETQTLRTRKLPDEHPAHYGRDYDDESETSDLYGGSGYHADIEDSDGGASNDTIQIPSL
ncbi:hypothetical protein G647_05565 [Cladophialophora carrionii CBS 160.54]|uniref:Uncharacterized protein n=1 Tax=Cladophialophora carrionii CBS 160.54 TaxID=1279043 RepID=V9DA05_9EURO|nr:uncharacterized protein G647_05565 [Cladophialophora carrionii CBS 160.54]ETI23759.1 hypothetical protein G647_05565 [Cladophialophora carrionii CBS 160.54]